MIKGESIGHVYPRGRRGTQLKQMDTEDYEAEKEEEGDDVGSFEDNMENMFSARGLNYKKPVERRASHQIKAPVGLGGGLNRLGGSGSKKDVLKF